MARMAIYLGVFLITLSGLIFEIGLTRIYSATIWYHFAFVAISVALLGWGLGGLALHLIKKRITPTLEKAAVLSALYGVSIPIALWVIVIFPFRLERLSLYFITPLAPFFLAGMALSMAFHLRREIAASLYFADLLGASLGALVVTLLLQALGGETTVLVAAVLPLLASAALSRRLAPAALIGAVVLGGVAVANERSDLFRVTPGELKAMHRHMTEVPTARVTQTGWNAYSRIDAVEGFEPPYLARLYIDSDAWTNVLQWNGDLESVRDFSTWYRALPFKLVTHPETLIIGPGGGSDVLVALASGSKTVTAVELNPLMLKFVRHYGARAGNLYDRPDVEVVQSEGRTFISRANRKFDVILLGFVDSWASVASGGLSLSENYLYTTQAFRGYYDHLTDDGLLAILRWDADIPRLVSNSVALLGASEAAKRIVVLIEKEENGRTDPPQMIFMLRKRAFTPEETAAIVDTWSLATPLIVPGRVAAPPFADLLSGRKTLAEYSADAPRRVDPVFDDSPFYFAIEKPWGMPYLMRQGLLALVEPVGAMLVVFVAFGKPKGEAAAPYASSVVYFAALGAGFIAIELTLLQNLTLLVGHPIYTLSVLLFTLLATSGLGSSISRRVPTAWACITVAALATIGAFALPKIVPMLLPFGQATRIAIAMLLIAPFGLLMGMPFPQGLRKTGHGALPPPPFYWGLNGVMSVLGSVGTVVIALQAGFHVAMVVGSACYLVAAMASTGLPKT
jgi:predicted membrane-bound spermidine synthase